MQSCALGVLALQSPVQMGVYVHGVLRYSLVSSCKTSEALGVLFARVRAWMACHGYRLGAIYYAVGPGSFMAMKLVHVFVHTVASAQNLKLYGALGFAFNAYQPIKAFGNSYYCYHQGTIYLSPLSNPTTQNMRLPILLKSHIFGVDPKPLYLLPPI
ncbi:hypothetical protein [Helicobacter labacensis]|uniref:hypothetical protein n=1 Tax=Helicobacter labacensis TaxID=2316079 RepID=UPI000EABDAAA|nr:hypothetical protein [Helicobacter labacensis]